MWTGIGILVVIFLQMAILYNLLSKEDPEDKEKEEDDEACCQSLIATIERNVHTGQESILIELKFDP